MYETLKQKEKIYNRIKYEATNRQTDRQSK